MPDLSDSVLWSEIDSNNNAASPNGWPEGMMPSGVNDSARADRGALKRFWDKLNPVQLITPSGGVYTFTTASPAYPTAYVAGEIYSFKPNANAIGGDQFQVNALAPKPIWKRVGAVPWSPIIAQDILVGLPPRLIYNDVLNGGTGVFVLLNPFVPISGDGAGGVSVPGGLAVAGDLTMAGSVTAAGGMSINGDLQVTGRVNATGYASRSGLGGPYQTNAFNIQWTGADGAHLWIDTTDQGPIVCAPGGNIVVGGSISAASLSVSGNIGASTLSVSGILTATNVIANGTGPGGISIRATLGAIQSDVSGTALYLPNGNVVCHSVTVSGGITVNAGGVNIQNGGLSVANDIGGHTITATGGIIVTAGGVNIQSGGLGVVGNVGITGNLSITGTINGLPAMAMFSQFDELAARVQALEDQAR